MDLVDILAGLGPENLAEKRKALMQWRINSAMGMLAPTTGTGVEAATRMLPMTGEAWTANDAGNAIQDGQYGKAAMMGLLGLLPLGGMMSAGLRAGVSVPKRMGQSGAIAWHGSPHKFDKFDLSKIGTGEGAQAYGHGLYLAEHPEAAGEYARTLANVGSDRYATAHLNAQNQVKRFGNDPEYAAEIVKDTMSNFEKSDPSYKKLQDTLEMITSGKYQQPLQDAGHLYKTDIPDEAVARFLDWDKPLSQQAPEVQAAISGYGKATVPAGGLDMGGGGKILSNHDGKLKPGSSAPWILKTGNSLFDLSEKDVQRMLSADKGEAAYTRLTALLGGQDAATQHLKNSGIPGIRYLDGGSRSGGAGTSNFVVFDPELIRILERNGVATGNQPWKPGEWQGMLSGTK